MNNLFLFPCRRDLSGRSCFRFLFILLYLFFSSLPTISAQQSEEGWRWKKAFSLQLHEGAQPHPVDNIHTDMAREVMKLHGDFDELVQRPEKVIAEIRRTLKDNPAMEPLFASLNTEDKTIGDIFNNEDPTGQLKAYWLENIDFAALPETNVKVTNIIRQNLQRLCTRNIVLAGIGAFVKGKYAFIPISDLKSGRRVVFLSGTGNRLVELLEEVFFQGFTFVTFDRPYGEESKLYDGFLKGNLGYVLSHNSDNVPPPLKKKSMDYKKELDNYIGALKDLQLRRRLYDEGVKKLVDAQPAALEARPITENTLRLSQITLRDTLRLTIDLEARLQNIQASYQTAQRLIPDFYHSEQLLRLFLYNNLESVVRTCLPFDDIEQVLALHIHSLNDVCERCAHCLFLESEMCNVIIDVSRPKIRRGAAEATDPYGFFEKFFNSVRRFKPDLKYQVLASSSAVGEQRGVQHRYQSGHDLCASDPINLRVFPPLLAFKIIPYEFDIHPLTPSLTQSNKDGKLHQTYFPSVYF
jgi:hypothetical protein